MQKRYAILTDFHLGFVKVIAHRHVILHLMIAPECQRESVDCQLSHNFFARGKARILSASRETVAHFVAHLVASHVGGPFLPLVFAATGLAF